MRTGSTLGARLGAAQSDGQPLPTSYFLSRHSQGQIQSMDHMEDRHKSVEGTADCHLALACSADKGTDWDSAQPKVD